LKTRPKSASIEPLIDLLAYLKPKLWVKNPVFGKSQKVSRKAYFSLSGKTWPAKALQQIELESCSNPVMTSGVV